MPSASWIFIGGYALLFIAFLAVIVGWRVRQRKDRRPFPDQLKLLRGPGETSHRQITELDERTVTYLLAAFALPLGVAALLLWITTHFAGTGQLAGLAITLVGLLTCLVFGAQFLVSKMQESANRYLGFFGERVVAEALEPLKASGCRVFHDVPAGETAAPFNIDHVVIGPAGIFAIETKTRRKGRSRAGFAAHEIIYDGQVLAYPWGEDRHGLEQSARQARWLEDWLAQLLGRRTPVQPILTFPGWMIIRRGSGTVAVLNPKEIPTAIASRGQPGLEPRELDLIVRQLETRCRDVEF